MIIMSCKGIRTLVVALAVSTFCTGAMADKTAEEMLKKAANMVVNAKTYSATYLLGIDSGALGKVDIKFVLKRITSPFRARAEVSTSNATGLLAAQAAAGNIIQVDDGKTATVYSIATKQYIKTPSRGQMNLPGNFTQLLKQIGTNDFKITGKESVDGKPATVIASTPKSGKGPGGETATARFFIDPSSGRLVQIINVNTMKSPNGGAGAMMTQTIAVKIQKEVLNAPIGDGEFKFTPPPGAKEMQPGGLGGPLGSKPAVPPVKK